MGRSSGPAPYCDLYPMCYKSQGTDENKAIIQGYFVLAHRCKGQRGCKAIVCFNNSLFQGELWGADFWGKHC